jgi:hypothetical protein
MSNSPSHPCVRQRLRGALPALGEFLNSSILAYCPIPLDRKRESWHTVNGCDPFAYPIAFLTASAPAHHSRPNGSTFRNYINTI